MTSRPPCPVPQQGRIFVSVAAFCDAHLLHTLQDACRKAEHPQRLVFGVVDQHPNMRRVECLKALGLEPAQQIPAPAVHQGPGPRLRYTHVDPVESRGVCWARSLAFALYDHEAFLLQIDSHMLFEPGWDQSLIDEWQRLRQQHEKPLLTAYPYGFEFDAEGQAVVPIQPGQTTLVMRPHPDTALQAEDVTLRFVSEHVFTQEAVVGCHIAGGFLFAAGDFVHEVPYDPALYFHGEEQSLALRAYTRGWDIFHPHRIPLYHLYKPAGTAHATQHWTRDWELERDTSYTELTLRARQRLLDLVDGRRDLGVYGLGSVRNLVDYARISGIDYANRTLERAFKTSYEQAPNPESVMRIKAAAQPQGRAPADAPPHASVGAFVPTHGRPDLARATLLQLAAQSRPPDRVVVFQNGDPDSAQSVVEDQVWPFALEWMHTAQTLPVREWYARPLQRLIEAGCGVFVWCDHDDLLYRNHVARVLQDLKIHDWRVARHADLLIVGERQYRWERRTHFTAHAVGGMNGSMAFNREVAIAWLQDLRTEAELEFADHVMHQRTLPRFRGHWAEEVTTAYVAHRGCLTSAQWVTRAFENLPQGSAPS